MTDWKPLAFDTIVLKAGVFQQIRAFFMQHDILEVSTPLLSLAGTTDPTIESLSLLKNNQKHYLQTSPEFFMKRLLAAGSGSIYQIAHAFRDEEQGKHHLTEFTLLEWYVVDWGYDQLMNQVKLLIECLVQQALDIPVYTYAELFERYVQIDPLTVSHQQLIDKVPDNLKDLDHDALLDYFLSIEIMPQLKTNGWFFVKNYPASQASLAQLSNTNPKISERFELFYNGLELANGFSELQNADEQLQRFKNDNVKRNDNQQKPIEIDQQLIQALQSGLPKCAGVAIGLERLMMVLLDIDDIQQVGLN